MQSECKELQNRTKHSYTRSVKKKKKKKVQQRKSIPFHDIPCQYPAVRCVKTSWSWVASSPSHLTAPQRCNRVMPDAFLSLFIFWPLKHPLAKNSTEQFNCMLCGRMEGRHIEKLWKEKNKTKQKITTSAEWFKTASRELHRMFPCSHNIKVNEYLFPNYLPEASLFQEEVFYFNSSSDKTPCMHLISLISNYSIFFK